MDKKYQVFISSTYEDMQSERQAAVQAILAAGHIPAGMELFAASDETQMEVIRRWIDRSDIFMLILGGRYGSIDPVTGKSYIQLEYEHAVNTSKPYFALYLTDKAIQEKAKGPLGLAAVEQNDTQKFKAFRSTVQSKMCGPVEDAKDVRIHAPTAINELAATNNLEGWVRASSVPDVTALTNPLAATPPKIEVVTGSSAPYYEVAAPQGDRVKSTVSVGIRNAGGKALSNCKVYVEKFSPPVYLPGGDSHLLAVDGFQLRYDDPEKLVEIAIHWSHVGKFRFCTPAPGTFAIASEWIDGAEPHQFVIRVVASECQLTVVAKIWTDESGLHFTLLDGTK